jgi:micrococcal nuclease
VRYWMLLAVALLILAGCSEASTPPEQPEKEGIERVEKEPTQKSEVTHTEPVEKEITEAAPEEQTEPQAESPKDVLASQYKHINAGNYGMAYDLFADQSKQLVSLEQYTAYFASVAPYEIKSYSFPGVDVQDEKASLAVDLAVSSSDGEEVYQVTQHLVREDGSWRVVMRDSQLASFTSTSTSSESASASSATPKAKPASKHYNATVTVSRVVDGDTIEISPAIDGVEDVRLIGVDTPETVDPGEEVEPYGPEASAFATEELAGRKVHLEFDEEKIDQYDRLLAYVYAGGSMFNEDLLEEGHAQAYPYPPNTKYEGRFADAQSDAMAAHAGIWGLSLSEQCQLADRGNGIGEGTPGCQAAASATPGASTSSPSAQAGSSATVQPSSGGAVAPISENDCPPNAPIKGNQSGLYHVPGGAYYDVTNPEECFATASDAEAAGYEASSR